MMLTAALLSSRLLIDTEVKILVKPQLNFIFKSLEMTRAFEVMLQ
jgi:hypothetical protein